MSVTRDGDRRVGIWRFWSAQRMHNGPVLSPAPCSLRPAPCAWLVAGGSLACFITMLAARCSLLDAPSPSLTAQVGSVMTSEHSDSRVVPPHAGLPRSTAAVLPPRVRQRGSQRKRWTRRDTSSFISAPAWPHEGLTAPVLSQFLRSPPFSMPFIHCPAPRTGSQIR